ETEAARLIKARLAAISVPWLVVAQEAAGLARVGVDYPDFVVISVGDINRAIVPGYAERMLEAGQVAQTIYIAKLEEIAASDGGDLHVVAQRHAAYAANFAVGNIERAAIDGQAAGLGKGRAHGRAIDARLASGSGDMAQFLIGRVVEPEHMTSGHSNIQQ